MDKCIRDAFFSLSFSGQIKVLEFYLDEVKQYDPFNEYSLIFKKYKVIVEKLLEFKYRFSSLGDDDRKKMRELINDKINFDMYRISPQISYNYKNFGTTVSDSDIDRYIYNFYSYDKNTCKDNVISFFKHFSSVGNCNFENILRLVYFNRDFFNNEIREISFDFYSLYLTMNTVDRMKYVWYLANFEVFTSEQVQSCEVDEYDVFKGDDTFIKPVHMGSKVRGENSKKLSKFFCMDCIGSNRGKKF